MLLKDYSIVAAVEAITSLIRLLTERCHGVEHSASHYRLVIDLLPPDSVTQSRT